MEDPLSSIFNYQEEGEDLRQKLLDTTLELEATRNLKMELLDLLKEAYQERDEAREQLQKLMTELVSSTSNELKNTIVEIQDESLLMLPAVKANSSITESNNSLSHVTSPIDSFFDAVSSPEFSDIKVVESHNMGYINHQPLVQDFSAEKPMSDIADAEPLVQDFNAEEPMSDIADAVIECIAKEKVLPQQGKLLQAVMDAGPLLQTLLHAGPLPTWQNPPPLQEIKIPPLEVKDFDTTGSGIELNTFPNTWNSFQKKRTLASSQSLDPNILNFAAITSASNASVKNHSASRNPKRHRCL
ncbi:uncharacterized protein LOC133317960 [Gastrolobium bilobum]|uniref:uncharacterized protein LOC133317960 n=1 Tax=Gastrolobium bilobum TaxID=150636 RepID=UPI002AB0425F|nr:uncharacterized protein LOC133317960 [Gastrolobium bilobum]